jgi:hypothetical protein
LEKARKGKETYDKLDVDLVSFGEEEESSDAGVEDLVVVGLSSQSEVGEEHVDVVSSSTERGCQSTPDLISFPPLLKLEPNKMERDTIANLGVRTRTSLKTTTLSPPPSPISALSLIISWNA